MMMLWGWIGFAFGGGLVWLYNAVFMQPTDYVFFTTDYQLGLLRPMIVGGLVGLVAGFMVWGGCRRRRLPSPTTLAAQYEATVWPPPVGPVADADQPAA